MVRRDGVSQTAAEDEPDAGTLYLGDFRLSDASMEGRSFSVKNRDFRAIRIEREKRFSGGVLDGHAWFAVGLTG